MFLFPTIKPVGLIFFRFFFLKFLNKSVLRIMLPVLKSITTKNPSSDTVKINSFTLVGKTAQKSRIFV